MNFLKFQAQEYMFMSSSGIGISVPNLLTQEPRKPKNKIRNRDIIVQTLTIAKMKTAFW